jgi:hypothetical protein
MDSKIEAPRERSWGEFANEAVHQPLVDIAIAAAGALAIFASRGKLAGLIESNFPSAAALLGDGAACNEAVLANGCNQSMVRNVCDDSLQVLDPPSYCWVPGRSLLSNIRTSSGPEGLPPLDPSNYRWVPGRSLLTDIRTVEGPQQFDQPNYRWVPGRNLLTEIREAKRPQ